MKDPNQSAVIVLRTTLGKKGEFVRRAREEKMSLNAWCLWALENELDREAVIKNALSLAVIMKADAMGLLDDETKSPPPPDGNTSHQ